MPLNTLQLSKDVCVYENQCTCRNRVLENLPKCLVLEKVIMYNLHLANALSDVKNNHSFPISRGSFSIYISILVEVGHQVYVTINTSALRNVVYIDTFYVILIP